jgi:putative membrane protein
MLNDKDRETIAAAVAQAEARTSGELVCVLARKVSAYREVPLVWAALASLVVTPILVALGLKPTLLHDLFGGGWMAAQSTALDANLRAALASYAALQAVVFIVVGLIVLIPPVRRLLTPGALKRHRVHQAALTHFAAIGLTAEDAPTGIVIFASEEDRRVEVVAGKAIHERCGQDAWREAVRAVQQGMRSDDHAGGFVRAVGICGDALAQHFPVGAQNPNRLSDRPVEI